MKHLDTWPAWAWPRDPEPTPEEAAAIRAAYYHAAKNTDPDILRKARLDAARKEPKP